MLSPDQREKIADEINSSSRTVRGIDFYRAAFNFTDSLRGQHILDVGAGDSNFAEAAWGATVTRVDPKYRKKPEGVDDLFGTYGIPLYKDHAVAGTVQELPFKEGTFDQVLASHSLLWVDTGLDTSLQEMWRVTKPGGYIKINPVFPYPDSQLPLGATLFYPRQKIYQSKHPTLIIPRTMISDEQLSSGIQALTKIVQVYTGQNK